MNNNCNNLHKKSPLFFCLLYHEFYSENRFIFYAFKQNKKGYFYAKHPFLILKPSHFMLTHKQTQSEHLFNTLSEYTRKNPVIKNRPIHLSAPPLFIFKLNKG